ncbi:hypothetical protein BDV59DRAFT_167588 [Aspergillus ambiguus]|uniref:uncharacterized protein n=1 Tax=Aspergillus ambiguus TaxID=176160 RepID=UPI003CCE045F
MVWPAVRAPQPARRASRLLHGSPPSSAGNDIHICTQANPSVVLLLEQCTSALHQCPNLSAHDSLVSLCSVGWGVGNRSSTTHYHSCSRWRSSCLFGGSFCFCFLTLLFSYFLSFSFY